jgi:hypothetical protein
VFFGAGLSAAVGLAACGSVSNKSDAGTDDAAGSGGATGSGGSIADAGNDAPTVTCDLTKPFGAPALVTSLNTGFVEIDVWLTDDSRTAYVASNRTDLGGLGSYDIYVASRASATGDFGAMTALANVNSTASDRRPVLSSDGLTLFFSSNRPVGDGGTGNNIFVVTRPNALADFGTPGPLAGANSAATDFPDSVTSDGKLLYLDSQSAATRDIYVRDLTTSNPPTPVAELNSTNSDAFAVISHDGRTIYFASNRTSAARVDGGSPDASARTDFDVWVAHRAAATGAFSNLAPVTELNTTSEDAPNWLSPDGCTIYLSSDRNAPAGARHIWAASKPAN